MADLREVFSDLSFASCKPRDLSIFRVYETNSVIYQNRHVVDSVECLAQLVVAQLPLHRVLPRYVLKLLTQPIVFVL